ncbi:MAG: DNA methylase [Magnetococcales bacterium]|nr:DNA methylase [Magnetococcales bacterium]
MGDLFENEPLDDRRATGPVECLGLTFENDAARRAFFLEKLREKLADPEFRKIEGFPIGSDADILALSDPPYYTACPNPFLEEFLRHHGKPWDPAAPYHKEPFAADVSEGKNDPIYNAHSYHTKVPHKAIMRYILHYTEPGDVVFDGFCGTGMTGVAAQLCGDVRTVESLGYRVLGDGVILDQSGQPFSRLGARYAVLNDLSPAATFIAYNYNTPVDVRAFEREAGRILREVEAECGWMYATLHKPTAAQLAEAVARLNDGEDPKKLTQDTALPWGRINYTVWSDVFSCPHCATEIVFWDAAVDKTTGSVLERFSCPQCQKETTKRTTGRAWTTKLDPILGQMIRQSKQVPVLINYSVGSKRFEKSPDSFDVELVRSIGSKKPEYWVPSVRMPEGDEARRNDDSGITHVHHFFSQRNMLVFSEIFRSADFPSAKISLLGGYTVGLKTARFLPLRWVQKDTGPMKPHTAGTLYIPSLNGEQNWLNIFQSRVESTSRQLRNSSTLRWESVQISTASSTVISSPCCSVDYLFLDPPFGSNLMYSELNFIQESWLGILTNIKEEAIENKTQEKTITEYRKIMTECFIEAYRILKPGRWLTVEFSNTKASVWNAIQSAIQSAGFVIANVSALDKQQGSFKAVTTTTAVKQDLVISAYKPNGGLEERFARTAKSEAGVWDFIRTHLGYLANVKSKGEEMEFIPERDPRILFDQLVAWYVRHNFDVPMGSAEFQEGLNQRFPTRDGMVFLESQVADYDRVREKAKAPPQRSLFVTDERSAIDWLRHFLKKKPSTYQEIHTEFMQQLNIAWKSHETRPELDELLAQNFLQYDGPGDVPAQLHSYLSTNFKELRNLEKDDPNLRERARERWYVPDPNKAIDLEKLRERTLLKEFESYRQAQQRRLKLFRLEAVRAGFKKAWQARDFATIIEVAKKIPEAVLEEDPKLIMWYDQAVNRVEEQGREA